MYDDELSYGTTCFTVKVLVMVAIPDNNSANLLVSPIFYLLNNTILISFVKKSFLFAERPLTLVREAQLLYYARMYMRVWKMRFRIH